MPAKSFTQGKPRVLLLEVDRVLETTTTTEGLRAEGYEVLVVPNWSQAIESFRTGNIDAVVINLDIPSRKLKQLVATLTAGEPHARTLVIARSLEQLILASEAGADISLIGPLDSTRIGKVMKNLLARAHTQALDERWVPDDTIYERYV
jgi:DNA-binding response OmpR family regulator